MKTTAQNYRSDEADLELAIGKAKDGLILQYRIFKKLRN